MTTLKSYNSAEDFNLFIAFHPSERETFTRSLIKIDQLMVKEFEEGCKREYENADQLEIVYRVQKPIFVSGEDFKEFFLKLRVVFNSLSSLQPHFTQYESEIK